MTLQDTVNQASTVAKASTKATFSATLIGVIPIMEFGLLVALTILVVAVPVKIITRLVK